jgi:pyruvate ferredoxin oxidoreductase gamma subunit/2-oxoisovalerate ferredoxin oxidoreductase gamma subunit
VVAGILLAKALFRAGCYVQTFPVFGVERRGAPVEAYLRVGLEKILVRSNIYRPDHVVIQDRRLLQIVDVTRGLKKGGWVILNASALPQRSGVFDGFRLAWVDATAIALEYHLGTTTHPIINTAMIGAFARVLQMPPLDLLTDTIAAEIGLQPQDNIRAARAAYDAVSITRSEEIDAVT